VEELASSIADALAPWFLRAKRDLPWRRSRDPYTVWVSEIMLQQTRVDTVVHYYDAFLARFPDVGSLAAADEDHVLQAWSGLGYYRRARLLHRGARHVVQHHGGTLPSEPGALAGIPGIGRYTAGAIASIAFDRAAALVDGNVARVLSRVLAVTDPKKQRADAPQHWAMAQNIVERGQPHLLAQALMELGATICTPRRPQCHACPLATRCAAHARDMSEEIPAVRAKSASRHERWWGLAIVAEDAFLLVRRPEGLLGNLWCLPLVERTRESTRTAVRKLTDTARALVGRDVALAAGPLASVKHVFTHRVWQVTPWIARCELPSVLERADAVWSHRGAAPVGGIPALTRKLLEQVAGAREHGFVQK